MYKVNFTKHFVKGIIAGIKIKESLHFASSCSAMDFVNHCKRHELEPVKAFGGTDYTLHDVSVELVKAEYDDLMDYA